MRESMRSILYLVIFIAIVLSIVMWMLDRPDQTMWILRIASPLVVLLGVAALYALRAPPDLAPDFLSQSVRTFFDRGGFCFGFATSVQNGCCVMLAFFQNRHENPCHGRIALRPAKGFFLLRAKIETITFDIDCGPAAFGVAEVPIPVAAKFQGKSQKFEVGASVEYPDGRGRTLRFRPGLLLRSDSDFGNAFHTGLTIAGALGGMIVLSSPASATLTLPSGVAEELPEDCRPTVRTIWRLGDEVPAEQGTADGG